MSYDKLTEIANNTRFTRNSVKLSDYNRLKEQANDLVKTFTYLDEGDATNRRVDNIVYSSSSLNLTVRETFSYGGSAGDYYVTEITLS